jgi:glutaconate CoA-transferase subunit A
VADEVRADFGTSRAAGRGDAMTAAPVGRTRPRRSTRPSPRSIVDRLWDGMTLGIGGWGSRRKPMSLVRAILRSDLKDLTLVSCGGPDVGMLCAAGKVRTLCSRS